MPKPVLARRRLLAVCILAPVAELTVLWAVGLTGDRALAVQVSAPSPWGVYHDLRWGLVLEDSWWALAVEAIGFVAVRSILDAVIVRLAWPDPADAPPFARQLRRSLWFVLAAAAVLLPWTVIGFGVDVVPISWLFFAAVPPVVIVAVVVHHGVVRADWWRRRPPARSIGWILSTFVVTTVTGAVVGGAPAPLWIPLVALGGLWNAWAWVGLVAAATGDRSERFLPVGPAVAVGMVAVAAGGATLAFQLSGSALGAASAPAVAPAAPAQGTGHGRPVLIVSGFDSALTGANPHPVPGPWDEVRYSYAGLSPSGDPLPYTAADTHQSLAVSVRDMATQVEHLARSTGQPVAIVAESEGSLVARTYLAAYLGAPVDRVVLLSPLDQPARVFYPEAGKQGYGLFTGYALGALTDLLGNISPVDLPADGPFLRSIVDHAGELRNLLECPTAAPEALVEPLADAVADGVGPGHAVRSVVVPAFHGGLLTDDRATHDIDILLSGGTVHTNPLVAAAERVIRLAAGPWQVPALPLSLDGGTDRPTCATMTADVRAWAGPPG